MAMEKVKPIIRASKVNVAVWIIPRSADVSVSLVRKRLNTALPNQTERLRIKNESPKTKRGELMMCLI
jgi:hypothetical protein